MDTLTTIQDSLVQIASSIKIIPQELQDKNNLFLYGILFSLLWLVLIIILKLNDETLLKNILGSSFSFKKTAALFGTIKSSIGIYCVALLLSFTSITTGISFIAGTLGNYLYFTILFAILLAVHFISILFVKIIGWIFSHEETGSRLITTLWLFNLNTGLLLTPFVSALFFIESGNRDIMLAIITAVVALIFLLRYLTIVKTLISSRVFISYIILYLCTFEISPVILLLKSMAELF